jgi:cobalt-zinc-cadmium efflux system protein
MSHNHSHGHSGHNHNATKNITVAFFLNLSFSIIELIGGLLTNSIAILSDALHDFGDSISLGVAWYLQKVSEKKPDKKFSYGYKRFSLLGAVFISVVLLLGSTLIIKESIGRIITPSEPHAQGMFLLAFFGVLVNGAAVLRLKRGSSMNERAVSIHLLEDVFGWIAVLIVSIVMMFVYIPILDPLLSIGISIWVLYNVYRNLKETFKILLQEVPENVDLKKLETQIIQVPNVVSIHDVHLWSLDGETHILTMHVVTPQHITIEEQHELKIEIHRLCNEAGIPHTTIEFESNGEDCIHCELDY